MSLEKMTEEVREELREEFKRLMGVEESGKSQTDEMGEKTILLKKEVHLLGAYSYMGESVAVGKFKGEDRVLVGAPGLVVSRRS